MFTQENLRRWSNNFLGLVFTLSTGYGVCVLFLAPTLITATLDGKPFSGAQVMVDGKVVGETPYSGYLLIGEHQIEVTPPKNVYTKEATFTMVSEPISASKRYWDLDFTSREDPSFTVTTSVNGQPLLGAIVEVDGVDVGETPYKLKLDASKEHRVTVTAAGEVLYMAQGCEWQIPARYNGEDVDCPLTPMPEDWEGDVAIDLYLMPPLR